MALSQKIRDRFLSDPIANKTLESLIQNEGKPGENGKKRVATEGLMWLLR